jgi:hypothetical protein
MNSPLGPAWKRPVRALTAAVSVLFLAACSGAPEEDTYAIANGTNADIGGIEIRSLLIVSTNESEPGRLLGTLFNHSQETVEISIADADDNVAVSVEGETHYGFDTNPALLSSIEDIPGSLVTLAVSANGDEKELQVPVLDGTLEAYRPYLPTVPATP